MQTNVNGMLASNIPFCASGLFAKKYSKDLAMKRMGACYIETFLCGQEKTHERKALATHRRTGKLTELDLGSCCPCYGGRSVYYKGTQTRVEQRARVLVC